MRNGIYSRMLLRTLRPEELLLNDLCPEMRYCCEDLLREKQVSFLSGDAETISFPDKSTLITSCSALQWFDSPEEFFKRCNTLLHSQGYFAFSTFGKRIWKRYVSLPERDYPIVQGKSLKQPCLFTLIYCTQKKSWSPFFRGSDESAVSSEADGVNGLSAQSSLYPKHEKQTWTRRDLQHFCERYTQEFTQALQCPWHITLFIS